MDLTEPGRVLAARVPALLTEWEGVLRETKATASRAARVLRVGFTASAADEATQPIVAEFARRRPGRRVEMFMYANGGFFVAGAIIEKITGNSYAEEVERTVIRPLCLDHTYVRGNDAGYRDPHPRAYSNLFLKDGADPAKMTPANWESMMEEPGLPPLEVTESASGSGWAAGNVVSTTSDMLRVLSALANGTLLPPAQHREMWTTVSTEGGHWTPHTRYGLGLFELDKEAMGGRTLRGMGGSIWGSWFAVVGTPDGKHTMALHTNTEWKSWDIMFDAIEAEFGISPSSAA
ncbi:serine hydrolase [Streptomyces sp. NPDC052496]|uniref:serine hydrolase n=1 Tax=Streptomyces sp. NPDC052496 TaxID=3154951 RepID=UPI003412C4F2